MLDEAPASKLLVLSHSDLPGSLQPEGRGIEAFIPRWTEFHLSCCQGESLGLALLWSTTWGRV